MKKRNKIISALVLPLSISALPLTAVSCGNKLDKVVDAVYESALDHFVRICAIPHITNHADDPADPEDEDHTDSLIGISNYVKAVASKKIDASKIFSDYAGNIWYDIPASKGCEKYKPLILQSHLDMVWAAQNEATTWNKWTHPVSEPVIETIDGYEVMHSKDYLTNLGVDNGNGVAEMLALTEHCDEFKHGIVRCIYTVNEEGSNCWGADHLGVMDKEETQKINVINHEQGFDWLINVDGNMAKDRADVIFNSAGGFRVKWNVNNIVTDDISNNIYKVTISGCKGGHSGLNIDDGLANPINIIGAILYALQTQHFKLCDIKTESNSDTSIPTGASFIVESSLAFDSFKYFIENRFEIEAAKYPNDPGMQLDVTEITEGKPQKVCNDDFSQIIFELLMDLPYGVGDHYEDETTEIKWSCNTGLCDLTLDKPLNQFSIAAMARVQEDKSEWISEASSLYSIALQDTINSIKQKGCGEPDEEFFEEGFKAWTGNKDSWICQTCKNIYTDLGFTPHFRRIHGGLECGDFINMNEYLQQISIGPLNEAEHGVRENLYLITYKGVISTLLQFIGKMNEAK